MVDMIDPTTPCVGIDLGTTFSCVGLWKNNQVEIVAFDNGAHIMPSMVAFNPNSSERLIGMAAFNKAAGNAKNTIFDAKRLIGRKIDDKEVIEDMKLYPFAVVGDGEKRPLIEVTFNQEKKKFRPEEISAMVLGQIKKNVEKKIEKDLNQVVITVPAYFNDA